MLEQRSFKVGDIVSVNRGRDSGYLFMISKIDLDNNYAYLVDGNIRKMSKPKKKNIKHINFTNIHFDTIADKILKGKKVYDTEIYSTLKKVKI
jgi:large subunit ribosomal protein L14e